MTGDEITKCSWCGRFVPLGRRVTQHSKPPKVYHPDCWLDAKGAQKIMRRECSECGLEGTDWVDRGYVHETINECNRDLKDALYEAKEATLYAERRWREEVERRRVAESRLDALRQVLQKVGAAAATSDEPHGAVSTGA